MIMRIFLAIVISVATGFGTASVSNAASDHIFDKFAGSWRGTGFVKLGAKSKEESIRCKMRNKNDAKKARLSISGNCVVGGFVFSLRGWIQQDGKKNRYTASMFQSIVSIKTESFTGKRSGSKLNFSFNARDRVSKEKISARIVMASKNKDNYDVQVSRADPKTGKVFKVGTIKFKRR